MTKFHPCKKCGATDYDNFEIPPEERSALAFGKTNDVIPETCDKCDIELMEPETDTIH